MSRADDYVRLVLIAAPDDFTPEQKAVLVAAANRPVPHERGAGT